MKFGSPEIGPNRKPFLLIPTPPVNDTLDAVLKLLRFYEIQRQVPLFNLMVGGIRIPGPVSQILKKGRMLGPRKASRQNGFHPLYPCKFPISPGLSFN